MDHGVETLRILFCVLFADQIVICFTYFAKLIATEDYIL